MVAFDGSENCRRAEIYYYDHLQDESGAAVSQFANDHIQNCNHCQWRIQDLQEMLLEVDSSSQACPSARDWRLIGELQRHFEFLGECVTCAQVKMFLPRLLEPPLKIRIPTPITVHVDHCPECARDLESLQGLGVKDVVYGIAERADFGVTTVCSIKQDDQASWRGIMRGYYEGYPIDVQVLDCQG